MAYGARVCGMFLTMILLFMGIGYALGHFFMDFNVGVVPGWLLSMIIFLIIAGIFNAIAYFYSAKIILWAYKVIIVTEKEAPRTYNIVKKIALKANIPVPKVGIMRTKTPNAFATGRNPKNAVVAVTEGLLDLLDDEELEGVISHEIAHVKDRDILVMSVAATLAGAIAFASRWIIFSTLFGERRDINPILLLVIAVTAPLAALIVQMAISRSREYKADLVGSKICQKPYSLASALAKLEKGNKRKPLTHGNPASSSLFIVNPFSGGKFVGLFSTHPPITERIKKLKKLSREMGFLK
jgi:heat shock protein HtpX